jgi:pimeloyl-ACP methyl ester carboxylesterase
MLERAGFRVMLPDARGHGGSAMISGRVYTAHDSGADALAVLEGEGVPPAHVVAAGWGAAAALAMASAAPHRVRSLLLVEPLLPELPGAATNARAGASRQAEIVREAGLAASKGLTERAVDLYLGMRLGEGWRDSLPKPHLAAMRRAVGSLGPHLTGLTSESLESEALRHLDVPVTLLFSAAANPDERDTVAALALLLPRSRTELVPLATKMAMAPDPWMEAIAMALRTSAPSPRSC